MGPCVLFSCEERLLSSRLTPVLNTGHFKKEDGSAPEVAHLYSEIPHMNLQYPSFPEPRGAVRQPKCMIPVQNTDVLSCPVQSF